MCQQIFGYQSPWNPAPQIEAVASDPIYDSFDFSVLSI